MASNTAQASSPLMVCSRRENLSCMVALLNDVPEDRDSEGASTCPAASIFALASKTLDRRQLRRYVRTFEIFSLIELAQQPYRLPLGYRLATTWLPLATTWLSPGYHLATTWLPLGYHSAITRLSLGYHLTTTKHRDVKLKMKETYPPIASRFGNEDGKSDIIRDG